MVKVVINRCFGGFSISDEAVKRLYEKKTGKELYEKNRDSTLFGSEFYTSPTMEDSSYYNKYPEDRTCPYLISVVEEMGKSSWGTFAELVIVEVPDDVEWEIKEHNGMETVREVSREWNGETGDTE